jgi:hypothetical protein
LCSLLNDVIYSLVLIDSFANINSPRPNPHGPSPLCTSNTITYTLSTVFTLYKQILT